MRTAYDGKTAMDGRLFYHYKERSLRDIYMDILAELVQSIIILMVLVLIPVFLGIYFFFLLTSNDKQAGSF